MNIDFLGFYGKKKRTLLERNRMTWLGTSSKRDCTYILDPEI